MRKLAILSMALIAVAPMLDAYAQDERATKAARPEAGETVVLASQVLQRTSKHGVNVQDLILDLETAHVALLVVNWKHSEQGEAYQAVLPWHNVLPSHGLDSTFWKSLTLVPPQGMDRAFANAVYASAKRDIYWSQTVTEQQPEAGFDRERLQLSAFSKLVGQAVVDKQGKALGEISDIGINDTSGAIAYCVITSAEAEHRAIPLGAFSGSPSSVAWTIDLDSEQVLEFDTCVLDAPPQSVARGWQEFVAVKYGRNALQAADAKGTDKK